MLEQLPVNRKHSCEFGQPAHQQPVSLFGEPRGRTRVDETARLKPTVFDDALSNTKKRTATVRFFQDNEERKFRLMFSDLTPAEA